MPEGVTVSKLDWIMSLDYDEVEALRAKLGLENCQYETPGNPDRLCGNPSYTMSSSYGYNIPVCEEHEHD